MSKNPQTEKPTARRAALVEQREKALSEARKAQEEIEAIDRATEKSDPYEDAIPSEPKTIPTI